MKEFCKIFLIEFPPTVKLNMQRKLACQRSMKPGLEARFIFALTFIIMRTKADALSTAYISTALYAAASLVLLRLALYELHSFRNNIACEPYDIC